MSREQDRAFIRNFMGVLAALLAVTIALIIIVNTAFDQDAEGGSEGETGAIRKVIATGSVFLTTGEETAQGQRAEYDVTAGTIRMTGDVVLNQGANAIRGEALNIDLNRGFGRMESSGEGRVKSVFTPGSPQ